MYETFIYILGTNFVNKISRHSSKNFSSLSHTHRKKFYIIVINRRKLIKWMHYTIFLKLNQYEISIIQQYSTTKHRIESELFNNNQFKIYISKTEIFLFQTLYSKFLSSDIAYYPTCSLIFLFSFNNAILAS